MLVTLTCGLLRKSDGEGGGHRPRSIRLTSEVEIISKPNELTTNVVIISGAAIIGPFFALFAVLHETMSA